MYYVCKQEWKTWHSTSKRLYEMSTITYSHCSVYLPLYFFILPAGGRLGFGNSLHEVHQFLHQQSEENNSKTSQHFSHIWNQRLQIQNTASAVKYCSEMTYYYSNTTKQGCFSTSISSYVTMIKMTHAVLKWLHFFPLNYDKNQYGEFSILWIFLPADLQGGLCSIHCPSEACVFSDVGQGHHTVVVRDQDDINGRQIQQLFLWPK